MSLPGVWWVAAQHGQFTLGIARRTNASSLPASFDSHSELAISALLRDIPAQ